MGTKNNPGKWDCYDKAEPDEPMFVLLARDPQAATLVRQWAHDRFRRRDFDKAVEAMKCADAMEEWYYQQNPEEVIE